MTERTEEEKKEIETLKRLGHYNPYDDEDILVNPKLFEIINKEFDKKIRGEEKSKKAIFLSLCSIWVKNSEVLLHTFVSSQSSTGKSHVCDKVLEIFPKEKVFSRSKITAETFTYLKENDPNWTWDGKICYLGDVSQALLDSPTFRVMCSEGSTATVVRNQKAVDILIKGKPVILVTTATTNPSSEVLNRFNIIQLDESNKQTYEITRAQAEQYIGEAYNPNIINALKSLEKKEVYIPFGINIHTFLANNYSFEDVRLRRDFPRILSLIKCSAALHQKQRGEDGFGRIVATKQDYEIAREIINYITGTTLKGLTHKLKRAYDCCIKEEEFTAKDIHSKYPFVSQKMWYEYLDQLCERNLLTTELRDVEGVKQRVTIFKVIKKVSFDLPPHEILTNVSIASKDSKDSNVTIDNITNETNQTNETENPQKIVEERVEI